RDLLNRERIVLREPRAVPAREALVGAGARMAFWIGSDRQHRGRRHALLGRELLEALAVVSVQTVVRADPQKARAVLGDPDDDEVSQSLGRAEHAKSNSAGGNTLGANGRGDRGEKAERDTRRTPRRR